ncbi:tyrosine--tRNA ligase [Oleiharenicola sp. Vm1]|uniref:tyrosine--tRNA ligase n=1 Tax=Oleiharenicola sp. Vm1 TaxID=3398393 RepID=UPI0039F54A7F
MSDILSDLQWRGLLADCTDLDGLRQRLATGSPLTVYCGFDPTGDSLHVGHLMGQLTLARFQRAGHHVIALAGGATGMVGDPSGRSAERNLLTREQLDHNIACIKAQLSRLLDFSAAANPARLVDNADWIAPFSFLEFLRDVGKHFSLNVMLAKDSVRSRMEGDSGISYTEFSYQLLQAYDFFHLKKTFGCELQIGGSDQWGNLTAGTDLIRKKLGPDATAWGWTFPLITKSDGTKFGKTASGAVWLDPQKTSPYRLYQFFVNTEDAKVCEYLRKFTFLTREQIEPLEAAHAANPGAREAHRALAREVTTLVHGADALAGALKASEILFGGSLDGVTETIFNDVVGEVPTRPLNHSSVGEARVPIVDLVFFSGLAPSKGQARKDVESGGIYVNNDRVDMTFTLTPEKLLFGRYLLLRKGKKNYAVLDCSFGSVVS